MGIELTQEQINALALLYFGQANPEQIEAIWGQKIALKVLETIEDLKEAGTVFPDETENAFDEFED